MFRLQNSRGQCSKATSTHKTREGGANPQLLTSVTSRALSLPRSRRNSGRLPRPLPLYFKPTDRRVGLTRPFEAGPSAGIPLWLAFHPGQGERK